VTDQRNRVTTDPGLGPIEREHASTLRSITAADPIPEDEIPGAPVYYEPKPLHAVSDHKTLELETVKLAKDIDPRKLPTELKLRRPVLQVLPASDPNWPAPAPEEGSASSFFDSNWPPPETVLTTSQPPNVSRRRSLLPLVLLVLFSAGVVLVFGARRALHRAVPPAAVAQAERPAQPVPVPAAEIIKTAIAASTDPLPSAPPAAREEIPSASAAAPSASTALTETSPSAVAVSAPAPASPSAATPVPSESAPIAAPARIAEAHHAPVKPTLPPSANSSALEAPPSAKQKRAIY